MLPSPKMCLHTTRSAGLQSAAKLGIFSSSSRHARSDGALACFFKSAHHEASASVPSTTRSALPSRCANVMASMPMASISASGIVSPGA